MSKSKKSLSIYQSRRVIDELENSLEQDLLEENSSIRCINRQVFSGMTLDAKYFEEDNRIKNQLVCRNGGDDNDNVIFSFITLEEENGKPKKVIYRWVRKPYYEFAKRTGVIINEEEHLYQGEMSNNRKHGEGEYIVCQRLSNATERNVRYIGRWNQDIFVEGTVEDGNGVREINKNSITFRTKSNLKEKKTERNLTIKQVSMAMNKDKNKSFKLVPEPISSTVSICDRVKSKKSNRVVII